MRTPTLPTPLSKSFGSPSISILLPAPNARCWSTMNGAVARPAPVSVRTFGDSFLLTLLSPVESYAAPPRNVSA